ncbi:MAG: alpha/beta hydrolase-fold protein [Bacteroidota bacterium]
MTLTWKKRTLVVVVASCLMFFFQSSLAQSHIETGFLDRLVKVAAHDYRYQVYVPSSYTAAHRWPVILFLHGKGERGSDGLLQTQVGLGAAVRQYSSRYPAIVVFPQAPADSLWTGIPAHVAIAALDQTMQEFQTDSDRVYLTGLSMGGNGAWYLAYRYPSKFAALAPICGWVVPFAPRHHGFETVVPAGDSLSAFEALAHQLGHLPTWIFHGEKDSTVPVEQSRQAAAALKVAGADVQYTEFPGIGHTSWDAAYSSTKFTTWLFAQRRKP